MAPGMAPGSVIGVRALQRCGWMKQDDLSAVRVSDKRLIITLSWWRCHWGLHGTTGGREVDTVQSAVRYKQRPQESHEEGLFRVSAALMDVKQHYFTASAPFPLILNISASLFEASTVKTSYANDAHQRTLLHKERMSHTCTHPLHVFVLHFVQGDISETVTQRWCPLKSSLLSSLLVFPARETSPPHRHNWMSY